MSTQLSVVAILAPPKLGVPFEYKQHLMKMLVSGQLKSQVQITTMTLLSLFLHCHTIE